MPAKDVLRYGLRYALIYVGALALTFVGITIAAAFYEFRVSDFSVGALIAAGSLTYLRFLQDKVRLPTVHEYWSLVAMSATIVLIVDFILTALVIRFTRDYGLDGPSILIVVGFALFKGMLGNMFFYSGWGFGKQTLRDIEAKRSQISLSAESPVVEPPNKMTLVDVRLFFSRYFAAYIPLYVMAQLITINRDFRGEAWLSFAVTVVAAICALAYVVRRLGRRPTRSEYWLLVFASAVCATVFEFIAELAIDYYRFAGLPNFGSWFLYMLAAVVLYAVIHAIAYSRPVAWFVRPRARTA